MEIYLTGASAGECDYEFTIEGCGEFWVSM